MKRRALWVRLKQILSISFCLLSSHLPISQPQLPILHISFSLRFVVQWGAKYQTPHYWNRLNNRTFNVCMYVTSLCFNDLLCSKSIAFKIHLIVHIFRTCEVIFFYKVLYTWRIWLVILGSNKLKHIELPYLNSILES